MSNRFLSVLAAVWFVVPGLLRAQPNPIPFEVTGYTADAGDGALNMRLVNQLAAVLAETGAVEKENAPNLFVIGGSASGNHVALSLFVLQRLPENLIEYGGEHEVFYRAIFNDNPEDLPEEGSEVRKFMSREYMRQFGMLGGHFVEVTTETEMEETLRRMVEQALDGPHIRR